MNTPGILFLDSFRMLRSQKLFWIVLFLSMMVALVYASVGVNEHGITLFFGLMPFENELVRAGEEDSKRFYLLLFTSVIVPYWLSLIAVLLGLVSCASIFPEFVKKGSVDLFLSKPPSRLTLFIGRYLGSLFFVFLQVLIFALIVFVSFGFRFGDWNFTIFWAVPIVVFIFSLIYSVHVLVSVWSGSVVFGLLAAFMVWGVGVLSEWSEDIAYKFVYMIPQLGMKLNFQTGGWEDADPEPDAGDGAVIFYRVVNGLRTPMPKTRVAAFQLNQLIEVGDEDLTGKDIGGLLMGMEAEAEESEVLQAYQKRHTLAGDIGTSLLFELCVVGIAACIFCRKDY